MEKLTQKQQEEAIEYLSRLLPLRMSKNIFNVDFETGATTAKALSDSSINWVIYNGVHGCGKTQEVVCAIYKYLRNTNKLIHKQVYYTTLDIYLDEVRRSYKENFMTFINDCMQIPILIIDEIRGEYSFSQDEMKSIEMLIDYRYNNELKTVLITTHNDFEFLSDMVRSRLSQGAFVKTFTNGDRRK